MEEIWRLDATAQAALVARGDVSAPELVDAAIARIERLNPALNVLACAGFDAARREAAIKKSGPFTGVPMLVKDLLPWPGLPCGFGSRLADPRPVAEGSDYAAALAETGAIVLGKSTTSEFGLMGTTETLAKGPTRNPWDLARSPAGSSGGSAAAVAAGLVPFAHASDGGGSIRIPAAVCGLFGFKPSRGRTRSTGVEQQSRLGGAVIDHAVTRSVRDSATLLAATQRTGSGADAVFPPLRAERKPVPRLRIGSFAATAFGLAPEPAVAEGLRRVQALCAALGHDVIETAGPPLDADAVGDAFFLLFGLTLAPVAAHLEARFGAAALENGWEPFTREMVARARCARPEAAAQAQAVLEGAARQMAEFVAGFDVVLSPTTPMPAFPLGRITPTMPAEEILGFTRQLAGYTPGYSIGGQPAMSVPLHWTAEGLPVGIQFAAALGADPLLLDLAYALEEAAPWADRWPACAIA
jgi:amidase